MNISFQQKSKLIITFDQEFFPSSKRFYSNCKNFSDLTDEFEIFAEINVEDDFGRCSKPVTHHSSYLPAY